jgi:3,4-dihydroxy 2-butanone 4-phosphate synthase/GTP cyclohydrolase II
MARMPDLVEFAKTHNIKIAQIADLIAYRRRNERIVEKEVQSTLESAIGGQWDAHVYVNKLQYAEHIALVKGDVTTDAPVMVRMHALNMLSDVLGDVSSGKHGELQESMRMIAAEGRGIVVLLREPHPTSISDRLKAREGKKTETRLLDYGVGAQILTDLGVSEMILLSNSDKNIIGLDGYGLKVAERRPIAAPA